jgi:hypothetical protein
MIKAQVAKILERLECLNINNISEIKIPIIEKRVFFLIAVDIIISTKVCRWFYNYRKPH